MRHSIDFEIHQTRNSYENVSVLYYLTQLKINSMIALRTVVIGLNGKYFSTANQLTINSTFKDG